MSLFTDGSYKTPFIEAPILNPADTLYVGKQPNDACGAVVLQNIDRFTGVGG